VGTPREDYVKAQKEIAKHKRLEVLAEKHKGKIVISGGNPIVHIHSFKYVTEDGVIVYEWP